MHFCLEMDRKISTGSTADFGWNNFKKKQKESTNENLEGKTPGLIFNILLFKKL